MVNDIYQQLQLLLNPKLVKDKQLNNTSSVPIHCVLKMVDYQSRKLHVQVKYPQLFANVIGKRVRTSIGRTTAHSITADWDSLKLIRLLPVYAIKRSESRIYRRI